MELPRRRRSGRPRRSRTGRPGVPLMLLSLQGLCPCVECASGRTSETPPHGAYPGLPESRGQELRLFHVKQQPNNCRTRFISPFHVEHLPVTVSELVTLRAGTPRLPAAALRGRSDAGRSIRLSASCALRQGRDAFGADRRWVGERPAAGGRRRGPASGRDGRQLFLPRSRAPAPALFLPAPIWQPMVRTVASWRGLRCAGESGRGTAPAGARRGTRSPHGSRQPAEGRARTADRQATVRTRPPASFGTRQLRAPGASLRP